tara:strand:+ start:11073 stop:11540 length:468 start_codon:yes stop_codon:yes gene_type:complete
MKNTLKTILLLLSIVMLVSCKEGNPSSKVKKENIDTAKERDAEINKGSAQIAFDITEYDFGTVEEGEIVKAKFVVSNPGETDLIITNIQPSCGCTVPSWPREPIAPGASAEILANFNTAGKPNRQMKTLTLTTNTSIGREVLKLKGSVNAKALSN